MIASLLRKPLPLILLLAFAARAAVALLYADFHNDYYWEYGDITYNLLAGKGYSYFVVNDLEPQPRLPDADPSPSAYVPPGYVLYLAPFLAVENVPLRNGLLLLSHILLSTISVWLLYRLARRLFGENAGLLAAAAAAFLPEFLYANLSFTPTVLYHFLILLFFLSLSETDDERKEGSKRTGTGQAAGIGALAALLIYLRSEFALFLLLAVGLLLWRREWRSALVIGGIAFAALLPWSLRNYAVFDGPVPMTTSFGLNLYRGHNPYYIGAWGDTALQEELRALDRQTFEIGMNRIYRDRAFAFMRENPGAEVKNSLLKLVRFWSWDPYYAPSRSPLYFVPNILLFLLWGIGVAGSFSWKKFRYYYLFFASSIITVVVFFPLPRYQTMMKILALPFAAHGALRLFGRMRRRPAGRSS